MTVVPRPFYFSLFIRLKIKLKGRHFDTIEMFEAESLTVLNTPTEHDVQDAFKNGTGNIAFMQKGTISMVIVACRPKVSF
jgi:hypothetical protein